MKADFSIDHTERKKGRRKKERKKEEEEEEDWLIDWTLFLNSEDISTKADSHICRCYSTTNNQDIHSEILLQKDIDKYSISKNKNNS